MSRTDDFQGDNAHLVECINALLDMDDAKALVPHGLGKGSHAYRLLNAAAHRIATDLNRANEIIAEKEAEIAELRRTDAITMAGFRAACEQRDTLAAENATLTAKVERLAEALIATKQAARYRAIGDGYFDTFANHVEAVEAVVNTALKGEEG